MVDLAATIPGHAFKTMGYLERCCFIFAISCFFLTTAIFWEKLHVEITEMKTYNLSCVSFQESVQVHVVIESFLNMLPMTQIRICTQKIKDNSVNTSIHLFIRSPFGLLCPNSNDQQI